ncbi:MAG: 4Fe-4S binding protein [Muribaculaceae bacterium]|nr:4Fe-4S binding protein [Muribaculaceae bacterium]
MKKKQRGGSSVLKRIRQVLAVIAIVLIILLFVDFSGTSARLFGWMARIQLLPALLALNFVVVAAIVAATLLFGRVYCSVICPLGIAQDIVARLGLKAHRNRYFHSPARNVLRYGFLAFMVIALVAGFGSIAGLIAPYSAFGRIVTSFLSPVWVWGNNLLAAWSESAGNYWFARVDGPNHLWTVIAVAAATAIIIGVLAWRNGRTWCNTVCPVGTVLGLLSRFSLFRPVIDTSKCNGCGSCARNCKSACIDPKNHTVDCSRCVACMDCMSVCTKGAISYTRRRKAKEEIKAAVAPETADKGRRSFLTITATMAGAAAMSGTEKSVDGGLAVIEDKRIPERGTRIVPPGAVGISHLTQHCTACQLCVSACPNGVLRPSDDLGSLMQPEASYENGFCRPECTRCSDVCPTGAILPVSREEKSSIQIGRAVWVRENCLPASEGVHCGNCARHCPVGAISMIRPATGGRRRLRIPSVDTERCIGCGSCEYHCPARPFSAIYVEGNRRHRII